MRKAIQHLRSSDPILGAIIGRVGGFQMQYREPTFEAMVRAIVYQQLSGRVASVIYGRFEALVKGSVTPDVILGGSPEEMRACGLSGQKSAYIRDLAEKTKSKQVVFEKLRDMSDADVIAHLTAVKGIGVWSAHMFLIFALRRPDILPTGDLGVRTAVKNAFGLEALPSPAALEEIGAKWRPYCSVAAWYLWRSLDGPAEM